ncbi:hypothetical protein DB32_006825 [Sandaracinus amylolyticus]|uniref:Uncharacterized protein n=1 Tax=Sandaracinus amylolyticus TaxID=927083 RepID=A0A0F6YMU5_9BACT|nr:hypothetical protein DB32_006825 [Sandaracinus amylolyticus]
MGARRGESRGIARRIASARSAPTRRTERSTFLASTRSFSRKSRDPKRASGRH